MPEVRVFLRIQDGWEMRGVVFDCGSVLAYTQMG